VSNEGGKKNVNLRPLPLNSKRNQNKYIKAHPPPLEQFKKKIKTTHLAPLNSKK